MDLREEGRVSGCFAISYTLLWSIMPAPYSLDLRTRAVAAAREGNLSRAEVARQFRIGERTLYDWLEREQAEGTLAPRPHGGGQRPAVDAAGLEVLRSLVEENNDRTLDEYALLFEQKTGIRPSKSALDRALARGRITRKKSR
jgi:transposase